MVDWTWILTVAPSLLSEMEHRASPHYKARLASVGPYNACVYRGASLGSTISPFPLSHCNSLKIEVVFRLMIYIASFSFHRLPRNVLQHLMTVKHSSKGNVLFFILNVVSLF